MSKRDGQTLILERADGLALDRTSGMFPSACRMADAADLERARRALARIGEGEAAYHTGAAVPSAVIKAARTRLELPLREVDTEEPVGAPEGLRAA